MTAQRVRPGELSPADCARTRSASQVHARDVLAKALVIHLSAATLSAGPAAHAALLILPGIQRVVEVERLEVTYDARRREVVECDATDPAIPGTLRMRRTTSSDKVRQSRMQLWIEGPTYSVWALPCCLLCGNIGNCKVRERDL